jgi:thioredoxin 1
MKQIIYFTATWCGPCKQFKPVIQRLSDELPIKMVDVDENPQMASTYNVKSIPTMIFISNRTEKARLVGVQGENSIRDAFNKL